MEPWPSKLDTGQGWDDELYDKYRADVRWKQIREFLTRPYYWHCCTRAAFVSIHKSGSIDLPANYPPRFEDHSPQSFGRQKNFVSLFDFVGPSEEEMIRQWQNCFDTMTINGGASANVFLIGVPRGSIPVVPNSDCYYDDVQHEGGCIPHMEVWSKKPIELGQGTIYYRLKIGAVMEDFYPVEFHPVSS